MRNKTVRAELMAVVALVFVAMIASTGCGKKPKPATDVVKEPTAEAPVPPPAPSEPSTPAVEPPAEIMVQDVFFDYDKYSLRVDARTILEQNAQVLSRNAGTRVLLEGHCDERGTVEYNMALGDRRAQSVKSYLVQFGIDAGRLSTISYGEERPFTQGANEDAWSQNRRVHFVIQK